MLTRAGLQVPVKLLLEVADKAGAVSLAQIGAIALNVGIIFGLTVTVKVVVVAHCPASGVKV